MLTQKKFKHYVGIRVVLNLDYQQKHVMLEHIRRQNLLINKASRNMYEMMSQETAVSLAQVSKTGKVVEETGVNIFDTLKRSSESMKASKAQRYFNILNPIHEYAVELGYNSSRIERMCYGMAAKFYTGMDRRNGDYKVNYYDSPNFPTMNNFAATHVIDGMAKFVTNDTFATFDVRRKRLSRCNNITASVKTHVGNVEVPFCIRTAQLEHFQKYLDSKPQKTIEGNLIVEKKYNQDGSVNAYLSSYHFMVMVEVEELYQYDPECVLSMDFNQRKDVFCVFNLDDIPTLNVVNQRNFNGLLTARQLIQKEINDSLKKEGRWQSKDRRYLRLYWKHLGHLITQNIRDNHYAESIVRNAEERHALLAIDDIRLSDKAGFGHYQMKEELVKLCVSRKVPYILVPTPHTSTDCNNCFQETGKYIQTGRSKDKELISCASCNAIYDADKNAAKNIADDAIDIWNSANSRRKRPTSKNRNTRPKFVENMLDKDVIF